MESGVIRVLGVAGLCVALVACPGGGTPKVTLAGGVECFVPPPTVTGIATLASGGLSVTANATVKCNGIGVQGVVLSGEIAVATGLLTFTFPPTNANGDASLTYNLPATAAVSPGHRLSIRVLDARGNPVPPDPVAISIQ